MNRHTFKDAVGSKRSSLANDVDDEDDDDREINPLRQEIDGEEDEGDDKFNEVGEVLEPFNLRDERDRGHFDENMNFVFKKEKGEIDAWLATMDEATMEQNIGEAAQAMRKKREHLNQLQESRLKALTTAEIKAELIKIMEPEETVTSAIKRLSQQSSKFRGKNNKLKSKSENNIDTESSGLKEKLSTLIDCADMLLSRGIHSIYDATYEAIENSLSLWEYQALDGSIQGPFTANQIAAWINQGYFKGSSAVPMRRCGWMEEQVHDARKLLNTKRKMDDYAESNEVKKSRRDSNSAKDDIADDLVADLDDEENSSNIDSFMKIKVEGYPQRWILSDDLDFGDLSPALHETINTSDMNGDLSLNGDDSIQDGVNDDDEDVNEGTTGRGRRNRRVRFIEPVEDNNDDDNDSNED